MALKASDIRKLRTQVKEETDEDEKKREKGYEYTEGDIASFRKSIQNGASSDADARTLYGNYTRQDQAQSAYERNKKAYADYSAQVSGMVNAGQTSNQDTANTFEEMRGRGIAKQEETRKLYNEYINSPIGKYSQATSQNQELEGMLKMYNSAPEMDLGAENQKAKVGSEIKRRYGIDQDSLDAMAAVSRSYNDGIVNFDNSTVESRAADKKKLDRKISNGNTLTKDEELIYAQSVIDEMTGDNKKLLDQYVQAESIKQQKSGKASDIRLGEGGNTKDLEKQIKDTFGDQASDLIHYAKLLGDYNATMITRESMSIVKDDSKLEKAGKTVRNLIADVAVSPVSGLGAFASNISQRFQDKPEGFGANTYGGASRLKNVTEYGTEQVNQNVMDYEPTTKLGQWVKNETGMTAGQIGYGIAQSTAESAYNIFLAQGVMEALGVAGAGQSLENAKKAGSTIEEMATLKKAAGVEKMIQNASLLPFGASGFNSAYDDARARGLSESEATGEALAGGIAEILTEKVSVDNMFEIMNGSKVGRKLWTNILEQSIAEGSEELSADIINALVDFNVTADGGTSKFDQRIDQYLLSGEAANYEEAATMAFKDAIAEATVDTISGAVSGGLMGGVGGINSNIHAKNIDSTNAKLQNAYQDLADSTDDMDAKARYQSYADNVMQARAEKIDDTTELGKENREKADKVAQRASEGKKATTMDKLDLENSIAISENEYNKQHYGDTYAKEVERQQVPEEYRTKQTGITSDEGYIRMHEAAKNGDADTMVQIYSEMASSQNASVRDSAEDTFNAFKGMAENNGANAETLNGDKTTQQDAYLAGLNEQEFTTENTQLKQAYNDGKAKAIDLRSKTMIESADSLKTVKATDKEGNQVTIERFSGNKVVTSDGNVHSIQDLNIEDSGAGNFIRQASMLKTDTAKQAFIDNAEDGAVLSRYSEEFQKLYMAGQANIPMSDVSGLKMVSETAAKNIYEAGVSDQFSKTTQKAIESLRKSAEIKRGTGTYTDLRKGLHLFDDSALIGKVVASVTGLNVVLTNGTKDNINAQFNVNDSTITVNSAKQMKQIFHEVGEFMQFYNQEGHEALRTGLNEVALNTLGGEIYARWHDLYMEGYKNAGDEQSNLDITNEMANDLIVALMETSKGRKAMAKYLAENVDQTVAEEFATKFSNMVVGISEAVKSIVQNKDNSFQAAVLRKGSSQLEQYADKFIEELDKAIKTYQGGEVKSVEEGITNSIKINTSLTLYDEGRNEKPINEILEDRDIMMLESQLKKYEKDPLLFPHTKNGYAIIPIDSFGAGTQYDRIIVLDIEKYSAVVTELYKIEVPEGKDVVWATRLQMSFIEGDCDYEKSCRIFEILFSGGNLSRYDIGTTYTTERENRRNKGQNARGYIERSGRNLLREGSIDGLEESKLTSLDRLYINHLIAGSQMFARSVLDLFGANSNSELIKYDNNGKLIVPSRRFRRYSVNVGYHAGDLGKSESLAQQSGGRDTGHFGTGTYFVGNEAEINGDNTYGSRPHWKVDFSKYNLFKPNNYKDGKDLHEFLKAVNYFYDLKDDAIRSEEEWEQRREELSDRIYDENITGLEALDESKALFGSYDTYHEIMQQWEYDDNESYGYSSEGFYDFNANKELSDSDLVLRAGDATILDSVDRLISDNRYAPRYIWRIEEFDQNIDEVANRLFGIDGSKALDTIKNIREEISQANYDYDSSKVADSASTRFMKALGYEGVDVRAIKELDNTMYGSVIYDLKGKDLEQKIANGARYSVDITEVESDSSVARAAFGYNADNKLVLSNPSALRDSDWMKIKQSFNKLGYGLESADHAKEIFTRLSETRPYKFNDDQAQAIKRIYDIKDDTPTEELTEKQKLDYVTKAEKLFGTTRRFDLAGYLTLKGTLLDFSEGQGYRVQDHREISEILDLPADAGYSDGLIEFMNQGNIRLQSYGIDIAQAPNSKQKSMLREFFNKLDGEVTVDFSSYQGANIGSVDYSDGTASSRILKDIDNFFETGDVPEGTAGGLNDFRYSVEIDSDGIELTKPQKEYFADTKVLNDNGNLLIVYHGTPNGGFTKFKNDLNFFTADKSYAERYTNPSASSRVSGKENSQSMVYEGYLKIVNPFDISDESIKRIFIDEYVKEGWALGIDPYQSDADIEKAIANGIDWTEADNLKEFFDEKGYNFDGIILNEGGDITSDGTKMRGISYVTFNSNQFKNIDNLNPTSDPDIRYSVEINSNGENLTEGQQKYFADTKARDDNGRLLKLYHGTTSAGFNVFKKGEKGGSWFTTSFRDADSYGGYTGKKYVPGEQNTSEKVTSGQYTLGTHFAFDTEADRKAFENKHPDYKEYKTEREIEKLRRETEEKVSDLEWDDNYEEAEKVQEEFDRVEALSKEIRKDYFAYEKTRMSDIPIKDIAQNPSKYSLYDLKRAGLELDREFNFDDEYEYNTDEEFKQVLADSIKSHMEEYDDVDWDDVTVRTRLPKGAEGEVTAYTNRRVYEVYANVTNPVYLDAQGYDISYRLGYDAIEKALADDTHDGVIIKNASQGAYGDLATIVITKESNQVKLTSNENPTSSDDIRHSIGIEDDFFFNNDNLVDEVTSTREATSILEKGMEALKHTQVNEKAVQSLVSKIKRQTGSKIDSKTLADNLTKVFAYMQSEDFVDYADMMGILKEVARPVIDQSTEKVGVELYNDFVNRIKGYSLRLTDVQKQEVKSTFGSYGKFRSMMMPLNISDKGDVTLEQAWQEISEASGYILPYDVVEGDMPIQLFDVLTSLRPTVENSFGADAEEVAQDLAMQIIEDYFNSTIEEYQKEAAKAKNKADKVKAGVNDRVAATREQYKEKISEVRSAERAKADERVSRARYEETYRRLLDVDAVKKASQEMRAKNKEYQESVRKQYQENIKRIKAENRYNQKWRDAENKLTRQWALAEADARNKKRAEKANEARLQREQREKLKADATKLYQRVVEPTEKKHVPTFMVTPVAQFMTAMDFVEPKVTQNEDGKWTTRVFSHMEGKQQVYNTIVANTKDEAIQRAMEYVYMGEGSQSQRTWTGRMAELQDVYNKVKSNPADFADTDMVNFVQLLDPDLAASLNDLITRGQGTAKVSELSSADLKVLRNVIANINHAISSYDKALSMNHDMSDLAHEMWDYASKFSETKETAPLVKKFMDFLRIDQLNAPTFFSFLGKPGDLLYKSLRRGLDTEITDIKSASDFVAQTKKDLGVTDKELKEWGGDNVKEFTLLDGTVRLNTVQIMALYETAKRAGSQERIVEGIKVADIQRGVKPAIRQSKSYHVNQADIKMITDTLTDKQKAFADAIQQYMALDCSKQGNDVANTLYGYEKYVDPTYFPYTVDRTSLASTDKTVQGGQSMTGEHAGFTNPLVKGATNVLVIDDIFKVFSRHVSEMSRYHGYTVANKDVVRWMNYKEISENDNGRERTTVKEAINKMTRSDMGVKYLENLLSDLAGTSVASPQVGQFIDTIASGYKAAAVMGNLRVVVQQPCAYLRALYKVDPKYLFTVNVAKAIKNADRMNQESPIAWWKSQGFFESNVGQSLESIISGQQSFRDKVNDKAGYLAGKADDLTWSVLYAAIEKEQKAEHKDYTEEQLKLAVKERFSEVIDTTQVVDATLLRSQFMRSKDGLKKIEGAFMAEPTKTYNMLLQAAVLDYRDGKVSRLPRAVTGFTLSAIATSAAAAIVDAIRYDDDDDKWNEVWFSNFMENLLADNLNILNQIPWIKDVNGAIVNKIMGKQNSLSRYDLDAVIGLIDSFSSVAKIFTGESDKTAYGNYMTLARPISQLTGIPVYSVSRDLVGIYNMFGQQFGTGLYQKEKKKADYTQALIDAGESFNDSRTEEQIVDSIEGGTIIKDDKARIKTEYADEYAEAYNNGDDKRMAEIEKVVKYDYSKMLISEDEAQADMDAWLEETVSYGNLDKLITELGKKGEDPDEAYEAIEAEVEYLVNEGGKDKDNVIKHVVEKFGQTIEVERGYASDTQYQIAVDTALDMLDTNYYDAKADLAKKAAEKAENDAKAAENKEKKTALYDAIDNGTDYKAIVDDMLKSGTELKTVKSGLTTQYKESYMEAVENKDYTTANDIQRKVANAKAYADRKANFKLDNKWNGDYYAYELEQIKTGWVKK